MELICIVNNSFIKNSQIRDQLVVGVLPVPESVGQSC